MKIARSKEDSMFSEAVRQRAGGSCEFCGKAGLVQCSHFHSRRKFSTRFDFDNACGVCFACHNLFHEHPDIHTDFFRKRLGSRRFEELNVRAQMIVKRTPQAMAKIKATLERRDDETTLVDTIPNL